MSWNNKEEIETTCSTVQQWRLKINIFKNKTQFKKLTALFKEPVRTAL